MAAHSSTVQQHPSACILCSRNCGITITTENGRFTKIKGDSAHPMTDGYICQKAARLEHYQNHDDRLSQPLKRQPDGSHQPISWDQALSEIATRLLQIRDTHGGDAFAFVGGGGQGNHLGGAYGQQIRQAMKSRYVYSALAQEKTQDFWVNGRLFGDQRCHTTEDVEHADYVLFIGCNPYQAHGIPNARDTLKALKKDPDRTMVVIDPRLSETAKMADIHLPIKPGTDAYLLSAMLAIIVQEGLHDREFLDHHCTGFEAVENELLNIRVQDYVALTDLKLDDVQKVAREFARARRACVRIDLGIQQTLNTTLNAYLEKLLYLLTGNFARPGGNNLHSFLLPILGNSDERAAQRGKTIKRTAHHNMIPIAGLYPPNILPDEIEHDGPDRLRAIWVDSANPLMTYADTPAYERAFSKLDLLVVVDVAYTETAQLADYVLPAASQYEKCEATGFNLEFPSNFFHLRHPIYKPYGESLPEPEIYTRLLEHMKMIPTRFPVLERVAKYEPTQANFQLYLAALMGALKMNKSWLRYAPSILYRTLGRALPEGIAASALLLPLAIDYVNKHEDAVKRADISGGRFSLGANLFRKIIESRSGTIISTHEFKDIWRFIKNKDRRVHLAIEEMLAELRTLGQDTGSKEEDGSFILMAGERRSYNANQIYRDPAWRKVDKDGSLRIHSQDAETLGVITGDRIEVQSKNGSIEVIAEVDDSVRLGMVTLPHGYGMRYQGGERQGPALNLLTSSEHCDPFTKTPYHKYVPVTLKKAVSPPAESCA
ncbi:molybdopterin oxidoreductase [Oleiphilus messinensis]|uniref:Molybdopterin oxidoreductase n=1 Tax=Oleiphilus messinensis TaxID=141451 RepID=A0A1Y0IG08_9GAMM|nr:molybdopterin-dependent oxidoreductase [Oleiphilus messinensis]ARU58445.1 molybdopterin oxidoreductase [Oleiphilus messinensis]